MMQHIAIIMDGNRRWARKNAFEAVVMGHQKGVESVKKAVRWCLEKGIKYLSLYAFSLENIKRSEEEKSDLFLLMATAIKNETQQLQEQKVAIRFVGDRSLYPKTLVEDIVMIENETAPGDKLLVQILFFYGAQQELVYAARSLAKKIEAGLITSEAITVDSMKNALWTAGVPDPEIVIRSGGQTRISNFLLYQTAYSEWFFLDDLWPDITESHLNACLDRFQKITRNFGQ